MARLWPGTGGLFYLVGLREGILLLCGFCLSEILEAHVTHL